MSNPEKKPVVDPIFHERKQDAYMEPGEAVPVKTEPHKSLSETLADSGKAALGGGIPGAAAMGVQVFTLMWLRTTMNYQYRHGTSTTQALKTLYKEGGVRRFYRGLVPALAQGPLSRFGDTASNAGMLALLNEFDSTRDLPLGVKTMAASATAALWRINLMPIDTVKTILQVEGKPGFSILMAKFKQNGVRVFYQGAMAAFSATFVGHYPWYFTQNYLQATIPQRQDQLGKLLRNAGIGFTSSIVSDTISNSLRVIKTTKQSHHESISYVQAVRTVVDKDGWIGLFGRGLKTRLITNGTQGMMFTVAWKYLEEAFPVFKPQRGGH